MEDMGLLDDAKKCKAEINTTRNYGIEGLISKVAI